jgi:uncharacterized protein YodC (DUF2158 family)
MFEIGDVAKVAFGGPVVTVTAVDIKNQRVMCNMIDDNGNLHMLSYGFKCLVNGKKIP